MNGSIGQLAQQVLDEVKANKLIKLAQQTIIKETTQHPAMVTDVGKLLHKLGEEVRSGRADISVDDVKKFVEGLKHAV